MSDALVAPSASAAAVDRSSVLDRMQWIADPLADATVAELIGPWMARVEGQSASDFLQMHAAHWLRIRIANKLIAEWTTNGCLVDWRPSDEGNRSEHFTQVASALERYVREARALPMWADAAKINRAEAIFMEHGVLSCLLLFCASLPECYVLPDLSDVLHAAGQLEQHTQHRIRQTAAMIFPVMMRGGLTSPEGSGVAQVLKVRLIHAMIRNLILHGNPESVVLAMQSDNGDSVTGIDSLDVPVGSVDMFQTLFAHGWDLQRDQLPCNQEELAYTLLTFHYIFLRGMRTLGVGLRADNEDAYLHAWNAMAHVLGVRRELMPQTMSECETMFAKMQTRGRADAAKRPGNQDPRPKLGQALMQSMEDAIPIRPLKGFPSLLTKTLCGRTVAGELGILGRASWLSSLLYAIVMIAVRCIDTIVRMFIPQFSLSRMIGRVLGYHMMSRLLMDQTRPLKLPNHLLNQMQAMIGQWSHDTSNPAWVNRVEDRLTASGDWAAQMPQRR
jgi:ER-bound oxygenase mpaB/B'/Rubber oxygenase, catalytic domain